MSSLLTIHESEGLKIELEFGNGLVFWHTTQADNFNLKQYKKMKKVLDDLSKFLKLHYDYLWTGMEPNRHDLRKLAAHGGFEYHSHVSGYDMYRKPL